MGGSARGGSSSGGSVGVSGSRGQPKGGGGVLYDNDDTYMTPLGRFDLQSRSA